MMKNSYFCTKSTTPKIQIFLIMAGFHSKNSDLESMTSHYSLRPSNFLIRLRAIKDLLPVEWRASVSYCEGCLIRADTAICFLDLGGQYLYLAWSAVKYLIMYMMYTATESRSGITKFFRRKLFNRIATLLLPWELPWIIVLDLLRIQYVQYVGQGNIRGRCIMATRESML